MAITYKSLGQGQLPNSQGDLYTVPGSTSALAKQLMLLNTNTTAETVSIFLQRASGTSYQYLSIILLANQSFIWDIDLALSTGDKIRGLTTTAAKVNYFIAGAERT